MDCCINIGGDKRGWHTKATPASLLHNRILAHIACLACASMYGAIDLDIPASFRLREIKDEVARQMDVADPRRKAELLRPPARDEQRGDAAFLLAHASHTNPVLCKPPSLARLIVGTVTFGDRGVLQRLGRVATRILAAMHHAGQIGAAIARWTAANSTGHFLRSTWPIALAALWRGSIDLRSGLAGVATKSPSFPFWQSARSRLVEYRGAGLTRLAQGSFCHAQSV